MKIKPEYQQDGSLYGHLFRCPACDSIHLVPSEWKFDGNNELPTFTPSLKRSYPASYNKDGIPMNQAYCCHLNITNGKIIYHSDCTHSHAGKVIDMVDIM